MVSGHDSNINIEIEAIDRLNAGISTCFSERDNGSRMLLEEILKDEEDHLDKLQVIYDHIKKYGDHYVRPPDLVEFVMIPIRKPGAALGICFFKDKIAG